MNFLGATALHRGFDVEATDVDDLPPINHIVFLVHGMGQLYHGEGGIIHSRKKYVLVFYAFFVSSGSSNLNLNFFLF